MRARCHDILCADIHLYMRNSKFQNYNLDFKHKYKTILIAQKVNGKWQKKKKNLNMTCKP